MPETTAQPDLPVSSGNNHKMILIILVVALAIGLGAWASLAWLWPSLRGDSNPELSSPTPDSQTTNTTEGTNEVAIAKTNLSDQLDSNDTINSTVTAENGLENAGQRLALLEQQVADLTARVSTLEKTTPATAVSTSVSKASETKEHFVNLGSGSTTDRNWVDIPSAVVTIDTSQYGQIKEVKFEAAMSIIGGEVYARLKNVTTGGVFYDSTVSNNTSASAWKSSAVIYLPAGSNQYIVQLKSSSGERASLDGSRIKIVAY